MNNRGKSSFCTVNSNKACIWTELANLLYNKVENNDVLRIETIEQKLWKPEKREQQLELDKKQEKNLYETLLIQDIKEEELKPGYRQIEKWSILSDVVKYVQYNQYPTGHYELEIKGLEERYGTKMYNKLQDSEREIKEISFDIHTESLKQDYLDMFEGVKSDVIYTAQYAENSNIGTTYLGMPKMIRQDDLKAEHKAPITEDCHLNSKLLDGTEILRDTGASKSFLSKTFYLNLPSLHSLTMFVTKTEYFRRKWPVHWCIVIPVVIPLQGHRFKYIHWSQEIHDIVDMIMKIKICME